MAKQELFIGAALDKAIKSVHARGKAFDNYVQLVCLSIVAHTEKTGDYTKANDLLKAMPKGSRSNTLIAWLEAFCNVVYDVKEKSFTFKKGGKADLQAATLGKTWFDFKAEESYKPVDLMANIKRAIAMADKRLKEIEEGKAPKDGDDKIDLAFLSSLKKIMPAAATS